MTWIKGTVTIDGRQDMAVPGEYRDDTRWNGWLCPRFDWDTALKIAAAVTDSDPEGEDHVVEIGDHVITIYRAAYMDDADYEPDVYEADADGMFHIGSMTWAWELFAPDDQPDH